MQAPVSWVKVMCVTWHYTLLALFQLFQICHHLFKLPESDADSFMLQVHCNSWLSMPDAKGYSLCVWMRWGAMTKRLMKWGWEQDVTDRTFPALSFLCSCTVAISCLQARRVPLITCYPGNQWNGGGTFSGWVGLYLPLPLTDTN